MCSLDLRDPLGVMHAKEKSAQKTLRVTKAGTFQGDHFTKINIGSFRLYRYKGPGF